MTPSTLANPAAPAYGIRTYRTPAKIFHWLTAVLVFGMIAAGVLAKQLEGDPAADVLFNLHKLIGVLTLITVLLRLTYRIAGGAPGAHGRPLRIPPLHWMLYGVVILVPLLGWAGVSDFGALELFAGYSLPAIWPKGAGYDEVLLHAHAYFAFLLLALIALHIGLAIQDYMVAEPLDAGTDAPADRAER